MASPPPSLTRPCARPVRLPERDLTGQEGEVLWGRDRAALVACGSQAAGLTDWIETTGTAGNKTGDRNARTPS
jgi:hypothetical protein